MQMEANRDAMKKEEDERRQMQVREMVINEFWKPSEATLPFFEEAGKE